MGQGGGQMGFAQADAADENDAGLLLDKGQAKEVLQLGLVNFLGPSPVELVEGFDDWEAGGGQAPGDVALVPALGLPLDEPDQVLEWSPLFAGGLVGQGRVVFLN